MKADVNLLVQLKERHDTLEYCILKERQKKNTYL